MSPIQGLDPRSARWRTLAVDESLALDAFLCRGESTRPLAMIVAGVHGDEYEGPAAIAELARRLDPETMRGTIVAIPVANPMAFAVAQRVSPDDGLNLARTFPGNATGRPTERLAAWIFEGLALHADYLIDLHSGGVEYLFAPLAGFYGRPEPANPSFDAARRFGLSHLWQLPETRGVLSYEASQRGVVSIGCEYLGAGRLCSAGVEAYVDGVLSCLKLWQICSDAPGRSPSGRVFTGDWQLASATGIFRARADLGETIEVGRRLAEITDARGNLLQCFSAPCDGVVLGLRSKAYIRNGDWGVLAGVPSE